MSNNPYGNILTSRKLSNTADTFDPGRVPIQPPRVEVRTAVASLNSGLPAIHKLANCPTVNQQLFEF